MREYGKIHNTIWANETFFNLHSESKLIFIYLLCGPHTTMVGCFRLPLAYISADLNLSKETVSKRLHELFLNGFITLFEATNFVVINNFLKFNLIENPNQGKFAQKLFNMLPKGSEENRQMLAIVADSLLKNAHHLPSDFIKGLETLSKGFTKPFRNQEQEQEQEQEQDLTTLSSSASLTRRRVISGGNDAARSIISYLNQVTGKRFEFAKSHIALINARLKEGSTIDQCKAVIDQQFELWKNEAAMWRYIRPKTLFNATNFADYVGHLGIEKPKIKNDFELLQEKYRLEDLAAQQGEQNETE